MQSSLTLIGTVIAYDDVSATSNPTKLRINRSVSVNNIPVENAGTYPGLMLAPGESRVVIDGTRTTTLDNTTAFDLALSPLDPTRYRATWTGGTDPTLRTARVVSTNTKQLTLSVAANLTLTVTDSVHSPFGAVQVGDQVFIPGTTTGDTAGPFNMMNEGLWYVLTASAAAITLTRAPGTVFSGIPEVVTPSSDDQFLVFSAVGVQVGDTVDISAGFAATSRHAYEIVSVTSKWIEFTSTIPLGSESGVTPDAAGFIVYTAAKRFLWLETDQEIAVRLNGDTGNTNRVTPWLAGDPTLIGRYEKVGIAWKVEIANLSNTTANVLLASAE
jgi:hypothetical protein